MQSLNLQIVRISDIEVKKNIQSVYKLVLETVQKREAELKFSS